MKVKYHSIINALEQDKAYTASTIVAFGQSEGLLMKEEMHRCRIDLARHMARWGFPPMGDTILGGDGQPVYPAWFALRWKTSIQCGSSLRWEDAKKWWQTR